MMGSMCFRGLSVSRPSYRRCHRPADKRFGVGVLVGHHREQQHRGPNEDVERNSSGSGSATV